MRPCLAEISLMTQHPLRVFNQWFLELLNSSEFGSSFGASDDGFLVCETNKTTPPRGLLDFCFLKHDSVRRAMCVCCFLRFALKKPIKYKTYSPNGLLKRHIRKNKKHHLKPCFLFEFILYDICFVDYCINLDLVFFFFMFICLF